ncbi:nicotinamide/nicotinic acid mononucleotide adenylyltransferase 3 [Pelomyxa schiedti]|nr:nicotinamide/nicotinic acid mononucleotide adenylyltransferase 3 [Pelomyxa schiedti]
MGSKYVAANVTCFFTLHLQLWSLSFQENARDYCVAHGANVVGGCLSPTNDAYAKPGLLKGKHRLAMCKMMCEGSKWTADGWEMSKHTFINTVMVLRKLDIEVDLNVGLDVTPMLVCGADLLDSFNRPGCWPEAHMLEILEKFGVLCVERPGTDTERFWTSPILGPHKANIHIIHQPITDALSSTLVRDNVKKGHSNKYLVPDSVIKYIADNNLFKS